MKIHRYRCPIYCYYILLLLYIVLYIVTYLYVCARSSQISSRILHPSNQAKGSLQMCGIHKQPEYLTLCPDEGQGMIPSVVCPFGISRVLSCLNAIQSLFQSAKL